MQTGQLNAQYISSIEFMDKREILNKVLDIWDDKVTVTQMLRELNRYVPTVQKTYTYHVNTRVHAAATLASGEAEPAAGADSTITLTAGSVKPRKNDIMLTAGRNQAIVKAVVGNDVTVAPLDAALIAHEAFSGGEKVTFFSNAYAEGTGVEAGYIFNTIPRQNNLQIIKGDYSVTDLAVFGQQETLFDGKPYYFIKGQHDAFLRFESDVAYALLLQRRGTVTIDGKAVNTTHGLEPTVRDQGLELNLDTSDAELFRADFNAFNRAIDQARGPKEYWAWLGPDMNNFVDDWLGSITEAKAGAIVYNSFNGIGGKERAVQFGFDSFHIYGRTWHKKPCDAFDHVEITAATGMTYPWTFLAIPQGKIKCEHDNEMKERLRVRYFEAPPSNHLSVGASKEYHEVVTGGLASVPTNKEMRLDISYTTWQGLEVLGTEHFAINTVDQYNS